MELDNILNSNDPAPVPEEKPERTRDEAGKFAKGEEAKPEPEKAPEKPAETPSAQKEPKPKPETEHVPVKALTEERRKRQELERRLAELERGQQQLPHPAQQPAEYNAYLQQQIQSMTINERMNTSELVTRDKHGDEAVDSALAMFEEAVQTDPSLQSKVLTERNPYGWLVKWAKTQEMVRQIGDDPDSYRAKIEQELRAKWEQERAKAAPTPTATPPPSLASAPSAAVNSQEWVGPQSLNNILKRK